MRELTLPKIILYSLIGIVVLISLHTLKLISSVSAAATLPNGFQETTYVSELDTPTAMTFSPDGRLFISEKKGTLRIVKNNALLPTPFISLPVDTYIERGLLGIAFDPDFASNRYIYLYYTKNSEPIKNRLSRFRADVNNPDVVEANSETILLDNIPSDSGMHNGGALHFGADGTLYISVGDGGSDSTKAQNLGELSGKILRLNKDGSIPTDNPFVNQSGARGEVWAYGLRNPFTFAIHPTTGKVLINDVGANVWEEINNGVSGGNYGWPTCEGVCSNPSFINPLFADYHPQMASITGAEFYTGSTFPNAYTSLYFFGDYVKNFIKTLNYTTNQVTEFATNTPSPVDIRMGPDASLYYLSIGDGAVYKISYGSNEPTPTPTPTISVTPTPLPGQGLNARYFDTQDLTGPALSRIDTTIDFDWGQGSPVAGIDPETFSVMWQGQIQPTQSEQYTFYAKSDDGVRLWVNNKLIVDSWIDQPATEHSGTITLQANTKYNIRLEYYEKNYDASIQLLWSSLSTPKAIVPHTALFTSYEDHAPVVTITQPGTQKYHAGQTISYQGTATDAEDAVIPSSQYTWKVIFHHNVHTHPFLDGLPASKSGSFVIPQTGETATDVWYRIYLTVTDSEGNSTTVYKDIFPQLVALHLSSNPSGISVTLDGQPRTTPYTFSSVVGMKRILGASETVTVSDDSYTFSNWSDAGVIAHTIVAPEGETTYTANYVSSQSGEFTNGLLGTYFDEMNLTGNVKQRIDPTIDFDWGQLPAIADIYKETFSVRWTGYLLPPTEGDYTFYTETDDGVRLWIDTTPVIDNWVDQSRKEVSHTIHLKAGEKLPFRMEFYDRHIEAIAKLKWSGPGITKQTIPTSVLFTNGQVSGDGLVGSYFDNKDFSGTKVVRVDSTVNFDWGQSSPIAGIQNETFSVVWTGYVKPEFSEHYTFYARTDDGVRVWVNNILIIDNFTNQQVMEKQGNIQLYGGIRYPIRVEYFDNTIDAVSQLSWSSSSLPKTILPASRLYSGY